MAAMYFSSTLFVFWLSKNNFGFSTLVLYYLGTFLVTLLGILYLPKSNLTAQKSIFWGIIFNLIYVLILIKIFSPIQLFISAIFSGLNVIYFWIPYNTMYFKYSSTEKRGLNSGIYYLITPIVGITLQPLAGIVADKFGFEIMFSIGILLYIIPIFLIRFLPNFEWNFDIRKELSILKFNWSTFFQGVSSRINYSIITIFTLFFITNPISFGGFFGYLALIAAVASIINGYISDKIKNKKYFYYLFSTLAVVSFLPLAFVDNPYYWALFVGISNLCIYLANPFWFTFNLDYYKDFGIEKTMALREFFLNTGYVFSLFIVFLIFSFTSSTKISLIAVSTFACILPIASFFQKVYRDKIS